MIIDCLLAPLDEFTIGDAVEAAQRGIDDPDSIESIVVEMNDPAHYRVVVYGM